VRLCVMEHFKTSPMPRDWLFRYRQLEALDAFAFKLADPHRKRAKIPRVNAEVIRSGCVPT
jgi:hypothetical protein